MYIDKVRVYLRYWMKVLTDAMADWCEWTKLVLLASCSIALLTPLKFLVLTKRR